MRPSIVCACGQPCNVACCQRLPRSACRGQSLLRVEALLCQLTVHTAQ